MAGQKYNKAYEAYQQAVYRDGRNPTFWCSIGVLYFQINQFRDALDAYSRAIRINPYISEVWFDLGSLYESCNNQISDAIDAYARASELDPGNPVISQRLQLLKTAQATGGQLPAAPGPQDVHPTAYASAVVPPPGLTGPPLLLQSANQRPVFRTDSRGPPNEISLPPPSQVGVGRTSPGPFRGGPPPPVILDESRPMPSHTPLAPMDVDRPPVHTREYSGSAREGASRGPLGHQNLLLHHPVPQQQVPAEDIRSSAHGQVHHQESYFTRPPRPLSRSVSPPSHSTRARSPPPPFQSYPPPNRQPVGPAQPSAVPSQRSPRTYPIHEPGRSVDQDMGWDRRPPPNDHREWDRERRPRHSGEYQGHPSQPQQSFYPPRSPGPSPRLGHSPPEASPRSSRAYWDPKPPGGPPSTHHPHLRSSPPPAPHHEHSGRRYDPRYDARDHREYDREVADQRNEGRSYNGSPEGLRNVTRNPPPHVVGSNTRESESPHPTPAPLEPKERRRRSAKEKEIEAPVVQGPETLPKRERKKRVSNKRAKEEQVRAETPKSFVADRGTSNLPSNYKIVHGYSKGPSSPEPLSSNGSGTSNKSVQPSPTSATPRAPARVVDEDYDEGVADALMGLASYRAPELTASSTEGPSHSPTISSGSRYSDPPPRPPASHRGSVSSTRSHASSPSLKRALSPGPDEITDNKRSRIDVVKHRVSPSSGRRTPVPSTRPSPIPFRTQPASHSPEARQPPDPYPSSPPLSVVLPPHPRPIGAGLSLHGNSSGPIALPPIATLSPTSTAPSPAAPADRDRDERMQVDSSRSPSPPPRSKLSEVLHSSRSPPAKHAPSPPSVTEKKEPAP